MMIDDDFEHWSQLAARDRRPSKMLQVKRGIKRKESVIFNLGESTDKELAGCSKD